MLAISSNAIAIIVTLLFVFNLTLAAPSIDSRNLSSVIPRCAQECVDSFIRVHYGSNTKTDDAALKGLCSKHGATEYTLGEGIMQCLTAERSVDYCTHDDVPDELLFKAYHICDNQPGAIKPTHNIITATLALATDGSGVMTFLPVTTTRPSISTAKPNSVSASATSSSKRLVTATSQSPSMPSATTTDAEITTTTAATTFTTATSSTTTTAAPTDSLNTGTADNQKLGKAQIAGVSLGAICGAAGVIGLVILLIRCCRQRRKNKHHDHLSSRESWGYNFEKDSLPENSPTGTSRFFDPIDADRLEPPGKTYNRGSWRPSAIGFAITPLAQQREQQQRHANLNYNSLPELQPASNQNQHGQTLRPPPQLRPEPATPTRPLSKLLPAKPDLPVSSRNTTSPPMAQPTQLASPLGHPSVRVVAPEPLPALYPIPSSNQQQQQQRATNSQPPTLPKLVIPKLGIVAAPPLMLDGMRYSSATEFEEDGHRSNSPSGQIWRPPSVGPLSATTYYVADKQGNWTLGKPAAQTEPSETLVQTGSTITANSGDAPVSQVAAASGDTTTSPPPQQTKATPLPLFSAYPNPRSVSDPIVNKSRNEVPTRTFSERPLPQRVASDESNITAISTSSQDFPDVLPLPAKLPQQTTTLSPVAESPQSRVRNQVIPATTAYPSGRVEDRGNPASARTVSAVPPPRRPIQYRTKNAASERIYPHSPYDMMHQFDPHDSHTEPRVVHGPNVSTYHYDDDRSTLPSARPAYQQPPPSNPRYPYPPRTGLPRGPGPNPTGLPYPIGRISQGAPYPRPPMPQQYHPNGKMPQYQQHTGWRPPQPMPRARQSVASSVQSQHHQQQQQLQQHQLQQYQLQQQQLQQQQLYQHCPDDQLPASLLAKRLGPSRAAGMMVMTNSAQNSPSHNNWQRHDSHHYPPTHSQNIPYPATPSDSSPLNEGQTRVTPIRRGQDLILNFQ